MGEAGDPGSRTGAKQLPDLAAVLGWTLVAYVMIASSVEEARRWADGSVRAPTDALERLGLAAEVVRIVEEREGPVIARTWFAGLDPRLDDRSPATLIREERPDALRPRLMAAARALVAWPAASPLGRRIASGSCA